MKNTISVTIRRRGISLVDGYMLMNSDTSTMIGIALRATASGVASSLRIRNRISRNADADAEHACRRSGPTRAFLPDTKAASLIRSKLSTNASAIALGAGRKYGLRSKACTANSHTSRKPMPNTAGATERLDPTCHAIAHCTSECVAIDAVIGPRRPPGRRLAVPRRVLDPSQRLAHLGDLRRRSWSSRGCPRCVRVRGRRRSGR